MRVPPSESMWLKRYGTRRMFRPRCQVTAILHAEAKFVLGQRFLPGTYVGRDLVNPVIQHLFEFYDRRLRDLAPLIASRDLVDFLLFQYDEANNILHGKGILDLNDRLDWQRVEPLLRRAIKYIVELLCIEQRMGGPQISEDHALIATEIALACAETAADLAEMSNRVHAMFPEDCSVVVHEDFNPEAITIAVTGKYSGYDQRFLDRIIRDRENRDRFVGPEPQFDVHTDRHAEYLNQGFSSFFGISYAEFIAGICAVINGARPAGKGHFPTLFIRRSELVRQLCKSGRPHNAIEAMLRGFTVMHPELMKENRVLWNAKQQSRAYRRGFFKFPHKTGDHLAFSNAMAQESMIHLVSGVCFQKLPREWMFPEAGKALATLSNAAGDWFEEIVARNLRSLGYEGGRVRGIIGKRRDSLVIPAEVGDLDFLGYHPVRREILLVEAKMTSTGLEAQFWRDDVQQFVWDKRSYAERFRRKLQWVQEHLETIRRLLAAPPECEFNARMFTLYPCIASEFIDDFPCQSITEFMLCQ